MKSKKYFVYVCAICNVDIILDREIDESEHILKCDYCKKRLCLVFIRRLDLFFYEFDKFEKRLIKLAKKWK